MFTNKLHAIQPLGCFTLYREVNEYIYKTYQCYSPLNHIDVVPM